MRQNKKTGAYSDSTKSEGALMHGQLEFPRHDARTVPCSKRLWQEWSRHAHNRTHTIGGMTMTELDGPRLEPQSGGPARQLIVFLHGFGADGNDLIDIGRAWQPLLPHAAFVSPHAPEPCAMAPVGRQWFPLTMRESRERCSSKICFLARPAACSACCSRT